MLICPACSAQYEVDAAKIPASGRSVKCASCNHTWMAGPWNNGNYAATTGFPQSRPGRLAEPGAPEKAHVSGGNYFAGSSGSFPKTNGAAALAALFDTEMEPDEEAIGDAAIVDAEWEDIDEVATDYSIEERLEEALSAEPIARIRLQQENAVRSEQTSGAPFHRELAAMQGTSEAVVTGTAVAIAPQPVEDETDKAAGEDLKEEARSALRSLARVLVAFVSRIGDTVAGLVPEKFLTRQTPTEAERTPGDLHVSAWREKQRRKAKNKMTPVRFMGWLLWAGTLAGVIASVVVFRMEIIKTWPEARPVYALFGVTPEASPFELDKLEDRYALSDKGEVIELRGVLRNAGDAVEVKPLIRAVARDEDGLILTSWIFKVSGPEQLQPQMELPFLVRSLAPAGIDGISVDIVSSQERAELAAQGLDKIEGANGDGFYVQRTTSGWETGQ